MKTTLIPTWYKRFPLA